MAARTSSAAVTQRGTNDMKGSAFLYFQNNDLRALDEFQRRTRARDPEGYERTPYDRQQFGFNLRGPIIRDKLFFAASYELGNTNDNIEVVPGRPAFNPGIWDQYAGTFSAPTKNHTGVLRLTSPFTEKHTGDLIYAGRYYDSETFFGALESRESASDGEVLDSQPAAARHVHADGLGREPGVAAPARVEPQREAAVPGPAQRVPEPQLRPQHVPAHPARAPPAGDRQADVHAARWKAHPERRRRGDAREHVELPAVEQGRAVRVPHGHEHACRSARRSASGSSTRRPTEDAKAKSDGWVAGAYLQDEWRVDGRPHVHVRRALRRRDQHAGQRLRGAVGE